MSEELKLRKTCYGCKAFEDMKCSLGYTNEEVFYGKMYITTAPKEPCPKPRSTRKFAALLASTNNTI